MTQLQHGDDIDRIMAVMRQAFAPEFGEAWTRPQVEGALMMGNCHYHLIDSEGQPAADGVEAVGFALLRQTLDEAELLLFAVAPQQRRRGLGKRLLALVCDRLAAEGAVQLLLEMREGNPAEHLYRGAGFLAVGRRPKYYRSATGDRLDAITFTLPIVS
ncbi:MAG TPA: GNAT family N-acetyltransferase [Novosphingobium sp.]|nr:GNAT family N-acetyltransferase [Novosphingobium sp.]